MTEFYYFFQGKFAFLVFKNYLFSSVKSGIFVSSKGKCIELNYILKGVGTISFNLILVDILNERSVTFVEENQLKSNAKWIKKSFCIAKTGLFQVGFFFDLELLN